MKKRIRVIPVLLLVGDGLYKTQKFKKPTYVGDPINAIKIFNDKEIDELCVLDIEAITKNKSPNFKLIKEFATECFMPVCYGGGINNFEDAKKIFELGIEKISINSAAFSNTKLITEIANTYGNQAVVASIDYKKTLFGGNQVFTKQGNTNTKISPENFAKMCENAGAGEIILNSIERDGMQIGYDLETLKYVSQNVAIPVIACGGAGNVQHFVDAVKIGGASAVAAGSMFVFHGKHKAVLINFPSQKNLIDNFYTSI